MVRYKEVLSKISNVDPESAMTALKNGLWHESRFRLEMTVNRPLTLEVVIHRAANYDRAEKDLVSLAKHMVKKKPPSNTWVRPENGGNNPRKANPQDARPQARKQHAPPGFAFNIGDESKEGGPQKKKWTRDLNAY